MFIRIGGSPSVCHLHCRTIGTDACIADEGFPGIGLSIAVCPASLFARSAVGAGGCAGGCALKAEEADE